MKIVQDLKAQVASYYDDMIAVLPRLAIAIVSVFIVLTILKFLRRRIVKVLRLKANDKLLVNFIDGIFRMVNFILGGLLFLYIIGQSGIAASLLGAATLSSVVIGFAFKDIAENFLAGVIMAFNRPFRIGDTVMTGSVEGNIVEMSLRDTHIKTFDGKDVYVPNGQIIKNPLYNYTIDGYLRGSFTIGVDYNTDIEKIRKIILTTVQDTPGILSEDKCPRTHVKNLNTSTVDIEVHYWMDTFNKQFSGLESKSIAQTRVLQALAKANVGMPADIVELKNYDGQFNLSSRTEAADQAS